MNRSRCMNFGRSFVCGNGSTLGHKAAVQNDPRFWVESVLRVCDERAGTEAVYYQCGSCKAENTFDAQGPGDLFKRPNYDFIPVFGDDAILVFSRMAVLGEYPYKSVRPLKNHPWGMPVPHPVMEEAEELDTFEKIVAATRRCLPLVGKTRIENAETQLRIELEYPIKTINLRFAPDVFQIDTGPVLFMDPARRSGHWADPLALAFVAYETRTRDHADFILESPVTVTEAPTPRIMHYDEIRTHRAANSLWGIGSLTEETPEKREKPL